MGDKKELLRIVIFVFKKTKDIRLATSAGLFVWPTVSTAAKTKKGRKKTGKVIKIAEAAHLVYDH